MRVTIAGRFSGGLAASRALLSFCGGILHQYRRNLMCEIKKSYYV